MKPSKADKELLVAFVGDIAKLLTILKLLNRIGYTISITPLKTNKK